MKTNIVIHISPIIPYLAKFWFLSYVPKCCQPLILQDSVKWGDISRKKKIMKFIFGIKVFYKVILSFWVCIARLAENIQNKKFRYLCNISISRKTCDDVTFLPAVKHKSFLQVIVSFWVCKARHGQNSQTKSLQYLSNIPRKSWRIKLIFCLKINKGLFKLILSF